MLCRPGFGARLGLDLPSLNVEALNAFLEFLYRGPTRGDFHAACFLDKSQEAT